MYPIKKLKVSLRLLPILWIVCFPSLASSGFELQTGDLVFIELGGDISALVSDETGSPYSHVGMILKYTDEIRVAHSLGFVHESSLKDFKNFGKENHGRIPVLRHRELLFNKKKRRKLLDLYKEFHGRPYNTSYLWGDDKGEIKHVYCSEFVTKLLNRVLHDKIEPIPMDFSRNWKEWNVYFEGLIPQGKLGNSPATLFKDKNFILLGDLKDAVLKTSFLNPCRSILRRTF